jgi:hypothetical protein
MKGYVVRNKGFCGLSERRKKNFKKYGNFLSAGFDAAGILYGE